MKGQGPPSEKGQEIMVFISYAKEDTDAAARLHNDLKNAGLNPWLDKYKLVPGQNWEHEIEDAISKSRYFIPLFSSISVKKVGYVQSEFKFALDVFRRYPPGIIFYIPARLDDCEIPYRELRPIHRADLFPIESNNAWKEGVNQILQAIRQESPLDAFYHVRILRKGNKNDDILEFDLKREQLIERIVNPHNQGRNFFCGGSSINHSDIDRIRIYKTVKHSRLSLPDIKVKRKLGFKETPVEQAISDEQYLLDNDALDVTKDFLQIPLSYRGEATTKDAPHLSQQGMRLDHLSTSSEDQFINGIKKYGSFYKCSEYRLLTIKENGQWLMISGVVILSAQKKKKVDKLSLINDKLSVTNKVEDFDVDKLIDVIRAFSKGSVFLNNKQICVLGPQQPILRNEEKAGWDLYDLKDPEGWPANIMLFTGRYVGDIIRDDREITEKLRTNPSHAFSSLDELSRQLVGFPIRQASSSRVYFVAPFYKKLDNIKLTLNGSLKASFLYHQSLTRSDFTLSVLYYSDSRQIDNFHVSVQSRGEQYNAKFRKYDIDLRRNIKDVTSADIFLVNGGRIIQSYHVEATPSDILERNLMKPPLKISPDREENLAVADLSESTMKKILQQDESKILEFKSSMLYDKGKNQRSANDFLPPSNQVHCIIFEF
ncbi:MAG: hypothetical protein DLM72_08325 [Candidatus Nitrosopolaris wilkensis]|nr:MAG: hypothetical protein DLM72_08325 [Candidatus Nitrosopolaris wilkensis]